MTGILRLVQQYLEGWEQGPRILDMFVIKVHPLLVVCNAMVGQYRVRARRSKDNQTYLAVLVDVLLLKFAHRSGINIFVYYPVLYICHTLLSALHNISNPFRTGQ